MQTVGMTKAPRRGRLVIDAIDGLDAARREATKTTTRLAVSRWRPTDPGGFNVAEIVPERVNSDDVVVYPMSYDYRIDPLILRRLEVIAAVIHRRILAVETPGVTIDFANPPQTGRSTVSGRAFWAGLRGDFSALADLQLRALRETIEFDLANVRLLGESLGAQSVMSMAQSMTPVSIDLIEPVNCRSRGPLALWLSGRSLSGVEEDLRRRYVERSRERGWNVPEIFEFSSPENGAVDKRLKRFWSQGRWAVLSALAMANGLGREANSVANSTPVAVWRGADSTACLVADASRFVEALAERGVPAELIDLDMTGMPAGHHLLADLDAATGFALELTRRWGG